MRDLHPANRQQQFVGRLPVAPKVDFGQREQSILEKEEMRHLAPLSVQHSALQHALV
jgi:hypothetical protein